MKIIVDYLGDILEPLRCEYAFYRETDRKGKPTSMVLGGAFTLTFEVSAAILRLMENTLEIDRRFRDREEDDPTDTECYRRMKITVLDETGHPIRHIELLDTYIQAFHETFQAFKTAYYQESSNTVTITFCSATQRINGAQNVYGWFIEFPYTEQTYSTPVYGVEEPPKKKDELRVELELSSEDKKKAKEGVFGFHEIIKKGKLMDKAQYSIAEALHQKGLTKTIRDAPYHPHWLSMRVGDKRTFKVTFRGDKKRYAQVGFKAHPHFAMTPATFSDGDAVTIECLQDAGTDTEGLQLQILGDNTDVVGAINVFYPTPKTIDLEWVFVEKTGDKEDENAINNKVSIAKSLLKQWIDKGFKPALIDVIVTNQNAKILDISTINTLPEYVTNNITEGFKNYDKAHVLTPGNSTNDLKITRMLGTLNAIHTKDTFKVKKPLRVYFTYFSCDDGSDNNTGFTNGVTSRGSGVSFMFMNNAELQTPVEVPHELMHAMGLPHPFEPMVAKIALKKGSTDNYMDYNNTKKSTYIWQWKQLHEYSDLK